jgi:7,8-dihydro-6-hydroxymethylpterin-pyrophosphokinase
VTSRRFVLEPLLELDPDLALPDGTRLADHADALGDEQRVERAGTLGR